MALEHLIKKERGFTIKEVSIILIFGGLGTLTMYGAFQAVRALNKYINEPSYERANVTGGPEAELFIDKDGKRFYAEIDGKPVLNYLK